MDKIFTLKPTQIIALGFLTVIMVGTFLLFLPFSSADGTVTPLIDCLFTATSATCITGLVVLETASHWSLIGKIIIICLIQIGGLGFMTMITMMFSFAKHKMTLKESSVLQESLNLNNKEGMIPFVGYIVRFTMTVEAIGALLLSCAFVPEFGLKGLWYGVFHSVSAFCNAGFDILGSTSLEGYADNPFVLLVIMGLIITGGLGFTVWAEIVGVVRLINKREFSPSFCVKKMSLHSKMAVMMTFALIMFGMLFFFVIEGGNPNTMGNFSLQKKLLGALFQSVTLRTAGFAAIPQAELTDASKLMCAVLMLIGGSPAGTAGGIKTVTVGVILFSVVCVIKGDNEIVVFKRAISLYTLQKALAVMFMMIGIALVGTIVLSVTEGLDMTDLLFETTSAIGTVGITANVTPELSVFGRLIICVMMFIGRIGPISMAVAVTANKSIGKSSVRYIEEDVLVG